MKANITTITILCESGLFKQDGKDSDMNNFILAKTDFEKSKNFNAKLLIWLI